MNVFLWIVAGVPAVAFLAAVLMKQGSSYRLRSHASVTIVSTDL
jgi:hypothetical protein